MFTSTRRRGIRALVNVAAGVTCVLAAVTVGPAPSASAFTVSDSWGLLGRISPPGTMITASGGDSSVVLKTAGVTMGASPGSTGAQKVSVEYQLEHFENGQWKRVARSQRITATVSGDKTYTFRGWAFEDPYHDSAWHDFRITVYADWIDVATQFWLGTAIVAPGPWGDTACEIVACQSIVGALSVVETSSL
jgi:hypothetical protein